MKKLLFIVFLVILTKSVCAQELRNCHQFPIPEKTSDRLFYLQRNLNANTVVYDANFDEHGWLDSLMPINIYWIRYEERGVTMPLRVLEKRLAFGVKYKKLHNHSSDFRVTLNATDKKHIYLKQEAPFRVTAFVIINGKESVLDHIYVQSEGDKYYSKVDYIEIFGKEQTISNHTYERIFF
ncbi:MAG: DUF4833 domain-containing protein [Bacteroidales bacterium]|nr:DUF4833 domain-containing protein [Bacteroidales bacterium]